MRALFVVVWGSTPCVKRVAVKKSRNSSW